MAHGSADILDSASPRDSGEASIVLVMQEMGSGNDGGHASMNWSRHWKGTLRRMLNI